MTDTSPNSPQSASFDPEAAVKQATEATAAGVKAVEDLRKRRAEINTEIDRQLGLLKLNAKIAGIPFHSLFKTGDSR